MGILALQMFFDIQNFVEFQGKPTAHGITSEGIGRTGQKAK